MPEIVKRLNLLQGINVDTVNSDIKQWDGASPHLVHTGIERDGGLTNLYKASESNSLYDEVFYCKSGGKVGLRYDATNDFYRVYSNGKEVCQVPPWGVKTKDAVRAQAEDVVATTDGKILTVRTVNGKAVIEEYDPAVSWSPIRTKEITLDATIVHCFFVRRIDQTFDTTDAVVGIYITPITLIPNPKLFTTGGLITTIAYGSNVWNFSQIFAWYSNGYILSSASNGITGVTFLIKSDGTVQAYQETQTLTARLNRTTDALIFFGTREEDVTSIVTGVNVVGYTFTPPVAPGGTWTIATLSNTTVLDSDTVIYATIGGIVKAGLTAASYQYLIWTDGITIKEYAVGHGTPPEFFGYIDGDDDDLLYFKMHTILYQGSYISASWDRFSNGVPISEVGGIDGKYVPTIVKQDATGDYIVCFKKADQSFGYVIISKDIDIRIQSISGSRAKINTIYAGNIIDTDLNSAYWGSSAFNGFLFVQTNPSAGTGAFTRLLASRHSNIYGNSVDTGDKILSNIAINTDYCIVLDFPENKGYGGVAGIVDVFYKDDYEVSIGQNNSLIINPSLLDTIYVEDNRIPAPLGSETTDLLFLLVDKIAIREANYDGYQLANEITGSYDAFELFGSIYLFDGMNINLLTLAAGVVSSATFIAKADGLTYLASGPTMAYFLSPFDNSIYTFDGGRSVSKLGRFSKKSDIESAYYSTRENTLLLVTSDSLIWIRDGISTENDLPYVGDFTVFVTENGIFFIQDGGATQYLYKQIDVIEETIDGGLFTPFTTTRTFDGGAFTDTGFSNIIDGGTLDQEGAIQPFEFESAYIGQDDNTLQIINRYALRFFSPSREETTVTVKYQGFNQETRWTETQVFTIGDTANPWDADGYAYISFRPVRPKALASSIGVSYADKLVFFEAYAYIEPGERAINKNQK